MENLHSYNLVDFASLSSKAISAEYEQLHQEFYKSGKYNQNLYECSTKEEEANRYSDILPYKHNVVKSGDQYFNASSVKLLAGNRIISTQAPVQPFENFWRIVTRENVGLIVMLCALTDPKRGKQADQYWPDKGTVFEGGAMMTLLEEPIELGEQFEERQLVVKMETSEQQLTHLYWHGWQDFGVPSKQSVNIVEKILESIQDTFKKNQNVMVHCSAGVGRTGTLIAIADGVALLNRGDQQLSVYDIVANIRRQRFGSIQTLPQYQFVHEFLRRHLSKISKAL